MKDHVVRPAVMAGGSALGFTGTVGVFAQTLPGLNDSLFMQLIEKGGGWVVLLVVLWSYKRDWQRIADSEASGRADLIKVLSDNAAAKQAVAVAMAENTEVLRQVSESLHNSSQIAATTAATVVADAAKAAALAVTEAARVAAVVVKHDAAGKK